MTNSLFQCHSPIGSSEAVAVPARRCHCPLPAENSEHPALNYQAAETDGLAVIACS